MLAYCIIRGPGIRHNFRSSRATVTHRRIETDGLGLTTANRYHYPILCCASSPQCKCTVRPKDARASTALALLACVSCIRAKSTLQTSPLLQRRAVASRVAGSTTRLAVVHVTCVPASAAGLCVSTAANDWAADTQHRDSDMNFLEVLRVCLFVIEWIWTACAAFLFPDKLVGKNASVLPDGNVCFFDRQLDLSRCNFGFAWGLIAFLVLSATLVWYSLGFCSSLQLPANVEVIIFSWLALWWVSFCRLPCLSAPSILLLTSLRRDCVSRGQTNFLHAYLSLTFLGFDVSCSAQLSSLL